MPPRSTRNNVRQTLAIDAAAAFIRPGIHFNRVAMLQTFIELTTYKPALGDAVEELTITLPPQDGYPAETVRRCLQLTPNVETLVLNLPSTSPATIFSGIRLSKLTVFSTNLSHRLIASFLDDHPTIDALVLQSCGRGSKCPLQGLELRQLTNLQCPSRCFAGIVRGCLTTATINLTRLTSHPRVGLGSLAATSLNTLTVDFYPDDGDILSQVAVVIPTLRHLKLNEKSRPERERRPGQARRPWNDLQVWHQTLTKMPVLEELMLRTLIPIATPPRTELDVVLGWVNGTTQRALPHPTLFHVGIIRKSSGDGQVRKRWLKGNTGVWECVTSHVVGPNDTFSAL